ncbi:MAG: 3-dehydroquinate synthase [bacterium]|nr:3-dehydroquinate synthase [bacterium]
MDSFNLRTSSGIVPIRFARAEAAWIAAEIAESFGARRPRVLLVTDENVALHHLQSVAGALTGQGFDVTPAVMAQGEEQKKWSRAKELLDILTQKRFARDDFVVALGGGVVTDLAGFVASIYLRGIAWVAAPTSLLGMVDAAIGGKTGVNHEVGKNLIGSFYQPKLVVAELSMLGTLPERELRSGAAEIVKGALLIGGEFWQEMREAGPDALMWSGDQLDRFIVRGAQVKIEIVARDEHEQGERVLLNLGHTFGHALEQAAGYGTFTHGEAVFHGLRAMLRIAKGMLIMKPEPFRLIDEWLAKLPLPGVPCDARVIGDALQSDKKSAAKRLRWVVLRDAGQPLVSAEVPNALVREVAEWLADDLAHRRAMRPGARPRRVLVLNGPNLNLLGTREPAVYGTTTHDDLAELCRAWAEELGIELIVRQSNSEGEYVSLLQWSRNWADGLVLNPGAFTHTSVAVRDALAAVSLPAVEVHISDPLQREEFRHVSLIADLCQLSIRGQGVEGYRQAITDLAQIRPETP